MSEFQENLKNLDPVDKLVLARVYDEQGQLVSVIPNLPGKQGSLKVINHVVSENGEFSEEQARGAIQLFGEHVEDAKQNPGKHPNLDLIMSLGSSRLKIQRVTSPVSGLLETISKRAASQEECDVFIRLLDQGEVRAAEKVEGVWQPQTYVIDGILNYFASHGNERIADTFWDKIPLKTSNFTDEDFEKGGVRYAPGSVVRTGAYIGPQTVIMNLGFVNIGAYIAGDGVMIDGGARVASCAQIGRGVKFGAGSGIEGILEPAGRLPSIVEDHVKIGAMCEVSGIVGEGSVLASGVVMASGKKIYDEATGEIVPPLECPIGEHTFLLPVIPPHRLAVGGSLMSENGRFATDAIILKPGDLRDTSTLQRFEKQGMLYN
ncbi:MAG: DUF2322 family protein [SAR324 cluster bacterium]|nr:DUF2322 family protein [SAR324 cluster bacterium]